MQVVTSPNILHCSYCHETELQDCFDGGDMRTMFRANEDGNLICQRCLDRGDNMLDVEIVTGNAAVDALLAALQDEPHNRLHRLVLADALEEAGDRRAAIVRKIHPKVKAVKDRLWPGSYMVHIGTGLSYLSGDERGEIRNKHGGYIMSTRDLCDMIEGRTLFVDPQIAEATEIERALAVLRLFEEKR